MAQSHPTVHASRKRFAKLDIFIKYFLIFFYFCQLKKNSSSVFFARLLTAGTVIDFEIQSKVIKYETGHDRHS